MSEVSDHAAERRPLAPAQERPASFAVKCGLLMAMGIVFFSTYGFANWLAGQHTHVPSFSFPWETAMPFWPWTIIPYWSIDLLYAVSFFLCKWRNELFDHAKRLLTVQCVSVACFILWPLRFGFDRPVVDGAAGALFTLLAGFDKPFNQAPSLHIGLLVVLWAVYAMRLSGIWRWALHAWFTLIGISVLTTYQHHMIDVPTGAAVGCFALFLFPVRRTHPATGTGHTARLAQSRGIARRYAAGALVCLLALNAVIALSPALALCLGWIALALLSMAIIYWRADPSMFQKNAFGEMLLAARILFAPVIVGAFVNSRAWTFRQPLPTDVGHDVLIGRTPTMRGIKRAGVTAVVDLTAEMPRWFRPGTTTAYACVPQLDLVLPTVAQLHQAVVAIQTMRDSRHKVLVCCALGYSRSALSVAAWLASHLQLSEAQAAVNLVRAAKPQVVISPQGVALLQRYIDWRSNAHAIPDLDE
jgi:hypothetical protein